MWRVYVCLACRIVSWHPCIYCPKCPGKMWVVKDYAHVLSARFPTGKGEGQFTPAEWSPDYDQPWNEPGFKKEGT